LLNFCGENEPESDSFGAQIVNFSLIHALKHDPDPRIDAPPEPVFAQDADRACGDEPRACVAQALIAQLTGRIWP
jgi:hypothetical protein